MFWHLYVKYIPYVFTAVVGVVVFIVAGCYGAVFPPKEVVEEAKEVVEEE